MSLLKYAAAAAIGYFAGQPSGRRQLERARTKVTKLLSSPQVEDLKQRGKDIAGEQASTVLDRVRRKSTEPQTTGDVSAAPVSGLSAQTEFSGRAVAEERRADVTPPTV
jgi:hypothetical protein